MMFIKKRSTLLVSLILLLFFFNRCKPEFSVNSDSEPFVIIYGLLDASEDVQYVKVFKSFLVEGNAYDVVKDISKYSYIDSIEVYLNEYTSGNPSPRRILMDTTTAIPKDSGVFLYPTQILYRTSVKLNENCTYEIEVFNPYTKNVTKTKVPFPLVKNVNIIRPSGSNITITDSRINFTFYTGENTTMYQLLLKYYYTEDFINSTSRQPSPIVWDLGTVDDPAAIAGVEKTFSVSSGGSFFRKIAENIQEDANVTARHTDSIVLEIHSAAKDWGLYLKSNLPSTGINQDRLIYSNITAYNTETGEEKYAMGIFSSRGVTVRKYENLTLHGSRDSLFHGRYTGGLKFTDIY